MDRIKIWIDLDNTPHVPFFKPIIRELEKKGYIVVLTARDAFQVCDLADLYGLSYKKIGRHFGKNPILKIVGLCWRSFQLLPFVMKEKPKIGLSHGSRAQILLCNLLRIPTVMIMDYEHAKTPLILSPRWEIIPEALEKEPLQCKDKSRILSYKGIKEDVYVPEFQPDPSILAGLGVGEDNIVITVRPPANEAHYHEPESDILFVEVMKQALAIKNSKIILLPRNKSQEVHINTNWPEWFDINKVIIPQQAINGLNLLWHSDLVVSGGGTMNREAAALGIPVYSIFRGKSGAIDRQLQREGRLILIQNIKDIKTKILFQHRKKEKKPVNVAASTLGELIGHINAILLREYPINI